MMENKSFVAVFAYPNYYENLRTRIDGLRTLRETNVLDMKNLERIAYGATSRVDLSNKLDILSQFWFQFSEAQIGILSDDNFGRFEGIDLFSASHTDLINKAVASFVLFKGIEEDVIWLAKRLNTKFPDLDAIIAFEPKLR